MTDQTPIEPPACSPCRGTGLVISGLGGEPSTQPCPWCEGTGIFIPDHDAQARFAGGEDEAGTREQDAEAPPGLAVLLARA